MCCAYIRQTDTGIMDVLYRSTKVYLSFTSYSVSYSIIVIRAASFAAAANIVFSGICL